MFAEITYYDIDKNQRITVECDNFDFDGLDNPKEFSFCPSKEFIHKTITIKDPKITLRYSTHYSNLRLVVYGWQQMASGGFGQTTTVININNKNES